MPRTTFTQSALGRITHPKRGQVEYSDRRGSGARFKISANGSASYGFEGRIKDGGKVRMGYGRMIYGADGLPCPKQLADVLTQCADAKRLCSAGRDPKGERKARLQSPTLTDAWEAYTSPRGEARTLAPKSFISSEATWRLHIQPKLGKRKVEDLGWTDCKRFLMNLPIQPERPRAVLSSILSCAVDRGWIERNPLIGGRLPRRRKAGRNYVVLDAPQMKHLRETAYDDPADGPNIGMIIDIALSTGARKGEILGADWTHFRPDDREAGWSVWTIPDTKQGKAHFYRLPPDLTARLDAYRTRDGLDRMAGSVFTDPRSIATHPRRRDDIKSAWKRVKAEAGLPPETRFHDLRHTFGTTLAMLGLSQSEIQTAMGYASPATTARYLHLAGRMDTRSATAAMAAHIDSAPSPAPTVVALHATPKALL